MTTFTTNTETRNRTAPGKPFSGIFKKLVQIAERSGRLAEVERLQAMSDTQLASRGMRRADIARHVYRDTLYL